MSRLIHCTKLNKEAEGLAHVPYPGELGQKIYEHISKEAWQQWLARQTLFINEYRLNLADPQARTFLKEEMEKFLFIGDESAPAGYAPREGQ